MNISSYFQRPEGSSTLAALRQLFDDVEPDNALFCFAYATTSGVAEFKRSFGGDFWENTPTRWLLAIDWGRTQPSAIETLLASANCEVRIYQGREVVARPNFVPSQPFHPKSCFLSNSQSDRHGMLAGSGNFSRGGLSANLECALAIVEDDGIHAIASALEVAEAIWSEAVPADEILAEYKELWKPSVLDTNLAVTDFSEEFGDERFDHFWIEAGYVTANRGPNHPGNQIDFPRGFNRFFGFNAPPDISRNSVIGSVKFLVSSGEVVRNLRFGNNSMEKISLPMPEVNGFGAYDGKILEFHRVDDGFSLEVHEFEQFQKMHKGVGVTKRMGSGRYLGYW